LSPDLYLFAKFGKFGVPCFHEFALDCNEHLHIFKIWHDKLSGIVKVTHSLGNEGMKKEMPVHNCFIKFASPQILPLNKF